MSVHGRRTLAAACGCVLFALAPAVPAVPTPIGPPGATILALVDDPHAPGALYAGTYFGGVYRSSDNGSSWAPLSSPLNESAIFSIAVDPVRAGTLYVATYGTGLYKSTDGGSNWVRLEQGLDAASITSVAVEPRDGSLVLAATNAGIFRSTDAGSSWTPSNGDTALFPTSLAFDCSDPDTIYIGTPDAGVRRSRDRGASWQPFSEGIANAGVLGMSCDPGPGAPMFATTSDRAYRLLPGATAWQDITANLPGARVWQVKRHAGESSLYAALETGVFRTDDTPVIGEWSRVAAIPSRLLHVGAHVPIMHAASLSGSLLATLDRGETWFPTHTGLQNLFVGALAATQSEGQSVVHAGTEAGTFTRAAYSGEGTSDVWARDTNLGQRVFAVALAANAPGTLFAGTENAGVWRSEDWGATWSQRSDGLVPRKVHAIARARTEDATSYAGTSEGLFVSRDDATTWSKATAAAQPNDVFSVAPHPVFPGVAYFGAGGGAIYTTFDHGRTVFRAPSSGLPAEDNVLALRIAPWSNFHAITSGGSYFASSDHGRSWFRAMDGVAQPALSIDFDPAHPWVLYLGTAGGGIYKSESAGASWKQHSAGLDIPYVFAIAVDPSNASIVYAGTPGHVYKSTDGARSWRDMSTGLPSGIVSALVIDPADGQALLASVANFGVYRSDDGGEQWTLVRSFDSGSGFVPIAAGAQGFADLFAGMPLEGLHRSHDRGASWAPASRGMSLFVRGIATHASAPELIYAASLWNGMFKSEDAGASWRNVGLHDTFLFDVAVDAADPSVVFAATALGVGRSTDAGASWTMLGQRASILFSMAVHPSNRSIVHVGSLAGQVHVSTDHGRTWRAAGALPSANVTAMLWSPDGGMLYAALEGLGVHRSTDAGASWSALDGTGLAGARVTQLASAHGALLAGSPGSGVLRSTDGGQSWEVINEGLESLYVSSLAADPADSDAIYAAVLDERPDKSGLYRYSLADGRWTQLSVLPGAGFVNAIAVDATHTNVLFAGTERGVFRSPDAGVTWHPAGAATLADAVTSLIIGADGKLHAGTRTRGVFVSDDDGASWASSGTGGAQAHISSLAPGADPAEIYAATLNEGFLRSTDGGISWPGSLSPEFVHAPFVYSIAVDPKRSTHVYAGTSVGVMKSTDGGISWVSASNGLTNRFIMKLLVDPVDSSRLYVGTAGSGVFVSDDAGLSWRTLEGGTMNRTITSLAVDAVDRTTLYAGTEGGGVYQFVVPLPGDERAQ